MRTSALGEPFQVIVRDNDGVPQRIGEAAKAGTTDDAYFGFGQRLMMFRCLGFEPRLDRLDGLRKFLWQLRYRIRFQVDHLFLWRWSEEEMSLRWWSRERV